jgi:hypothetical protein
MTVADPGLGLDDVNLENDVFADRVPHETFALLRREAPVWWYDWPHRRPRADGPAGTDAHELHERPQAHAGARDGEGRHR